MPAIILENIGEVGEVDGIPPTGSEIVVVVDKHPRMMTVIRHRWTIPLNPNHPGECTAIIVRPKE